MANQRKIPAAFYRGGTSKAVIFKSTDLPRDPDTWPAIFRSVMGSPDPNGRQRDGMGGGLSSLSKVCVIGPSTRPDADVDYTLAQVGIADDIVDFRGNCGNMSSAIGPFAVDAGLVRLDGATSNATVRIHNTNTGQLIEACFALRDGFVYPRD
ncbi:MAG: PrpF domain-containing protein [Pseudomonadota bacterium]